MITTKGRLLQGICVNFAKGELRVTGLRLDDGEGIAILIDHLKNQARLYAPFEECQRYAAKYYYELYIPRREDETFSSYVQRFLSLTQSKDEEPDPPRNGEAGL